MDGLSEGTSDGTMDGESDGVKDGSIDGSSEGICEGESDGLVEGTIEGASDGLLVGFKVGKGEGIGEGGREGEVRGGGCGDAVNLPEVQGRGVTIIDQGVGRAGLIGGVSPWRWYLVVIRAQAIRQLIQPEVRATARPARMIRYKLQVINSC